MNQLKVVGPSPKPTSPVQASDDFSDSFDTQAFVDPASSSMPFGTADPFANDPFATAQCSTAQHVSQAVFTTNVSAESEEDDLYNIPLPQGPPPPLPQDIASVSLYTEPKDGPPPPPRPSINPPPCLPQIPPRPKSASSESFKSSSTSLNSMSDTQTVNQDFTPPPAPRRRPDCNIVPVPRPRPRASIPQTDSHKSVCNNNNQSDINKNMHLANSVINNNKSDLDCVRNVTKSDTQRTNFQLPTPISQPSAKPERLESCESQTSNVSNSSTSTNGKRSSSVVPDPFVSTDPFAAEDPFTQADPFANDPFSQDPFTDSSVEKKEDPFVSTVSSPRPNPDSTDPFSVFDNKFSNESFKFEKSSSSAKKGKVKVSGKILSPSFFLLTKSIIFLICYYDYEYLIWRRYKEDLVKRRKHPLPMLSYNNVKC